MNHKITLKELSPKFKTFIKMFYNEDVIIGKDINGNDVKLYINETKNNN